MQKKVRSSGRHWRIAWLASRGSQLLADASDVSYSLWFAEGCRFLISFLTYAFIHSLAWQWTSNTKDFTPRPVSHHRIKDEETTSPSTWHCPQAPKQRLTMAALWSLLFLVWVNIHPPIMSVCLMPTRPSTRQSSEICFEDYNNTDPNIVNHKIDITEPTSYTAHLDPDYQDSANESSSEPVLESRTNSIQSQLPSRKLNSYHHHYQHHPHHPHHHQQQQLNRPKSSSLFIPVAAYSITKKKPKKKPKIKSVPKMSASTVSVRRKRPNIVYEEASSDEDNEEQGEEPDLDGEGTEDDYEMRKVRIRYLFNWWNWKWTVIDILHFTF